MATVFRNHAKTARGADQADRACPIEAANPEKDKAKLCLLDNPQEVPLKKRETFANFLWARGPKARALLDPTGAETLIWRSCGTSRLFFGEHVAGRTGLFPHAAILRLDFYRERVPKLQVVTLRHWVFFD